jgi:hypothetical protein
MEKIAGCAYTGLPYSTSGDHGSIANDYMRIRPGTHIKKAANSVAANPLKLFSP